MTLKPKGAVVGAPITPTSLRTMGALDRFPPPPDDFRPDAGWVQLYRIWTCHGYLNDSNDDQGFLRIERVAGESGGPFTLKIDQEILHDRANLHLLHVEITAALDALASPLEWKLTSRFLGHDGAPRPRLGMQESAKVVGTDWQVTTNGLTSRRTLAGRTTADWCLFEALQRLPFGNDLPGEFDMLEGLSLVRAGHRLAYRGTYSLDQTKLHWFQQLGAGTFPYEYWLDDRHRLVAAVSNARAYILDDAAIETTKMHVQRSRQYELERQRKRSGGKA